jgi:hypothetical protein
MGRRPSDSLLTRQCLAMSSSSAAPISVDRHEGAVKAVCRVIDFNAAFLIATCKARHLKPPPKRAAALFDRCVARLRKSCVNANYALLTTFFI